MPLLRNGEWLSNDAAESSQPISLQQYLELNATQQALVSSIFINPEDDVQALCGCLNSLALIVVYFPQYTDGRGYSHARIMRSQMGFSGEIRAEGDIRPDQLLFMIRAGIDSFNFESQQNDQHIQKILTRYETNYQPSYALPVVVG